MSDCVCVCVNDLLDDRLLHHLVDGHRNLCVRARVRNLCVCARGCKCRNLCVRAKANGGETMAAVPGQNSTC